jgi:hypothetical protein
MSADIPEILFKLAMAGFGLQYAFAAALRQRVDGDEDLRSALFANPVVQGQSNPGRFLRIKFFWPLAHIPPQLSECVPTTVVLFWAARLSGFFFVVSIATFFGSMFVLAGS